MCTTLGACNPVKPIEVESVYIDQWLEAVKDPSESPNPGQFYYLENGKEKETHEDYELKVRDTIKDGVKNTTSKKVDYKYTVKDGVDYVGYLVRNSVGRLTYCNIKIYDDGEIITGAGGSGWGSPKDQFFVYSVGTTITSEIISEVKARYAEITEQLKNDYEIVKEEASIENFFKAVEATDVPASIHYKETRVNKEPYETNDLADKDYAILNELKELDYQSKERDYSTGLLPMFQYFVPDKNWSLNIYCDDNDIKYDVAAIEYVSQGSLKSYYPSHYKFYYSINAAKAESLITRMINGN